MKSRLPPSREPGAADSKGGREPDSNENRRTSALSSTTTPTPRPAAPSLRGIIPSPRPSASPSRPGTTVPTPIPSAKGSIRPSWPGGVTRNVPWSWFDEPESDPFRPEPIPGLLLGGNIRLESLLRTGGMAEIWTATHLDLNKKVAVKLSSPLSKHVNLAHARFEREASVAACIQSPYVALVLGSGVDRGLPYMVMELLHGVDLNTHLRSLPHGIMPIGHTARILNAVGEALAQAHKAGILHRDIKPENIFLDRGPEGEIPKLLDFGIAKPITDHSDDSAERKGSLAGTPAYMSPEQARGAHDIDHRSDLWSLAVVAYRAVTGKKPFVTASYGEMLDRIANDPIPKPSSLNPALPESVDRFFERALARDPSARFESAEELTKAFSELADHIERQTAQEHIETQTPSPISPPIESAPITTAPSSELLPQHLSRYTRKRLTQAQKIALTAVVFTILIVLIATAVFLMRR